MELFGAVEVTEVAFLELAELSLIAIGRGFS
jgi:hypothetical protein